MGLFGKIKNILFEEEEIEVPVKEAKKVEKKPVEEKEPFKQEDRLEKAKQVVEKTESPVLFEKEPTFDFPDFDEDEFENTLPKHIDTPSETRTSKLYSEHQRELKKEEEPIKKREETFKKSEVRSIGKGLSLFDKTPLEKSDKKKFRPSPIISPVYGILDKDYHPDDISSKETGELKRGNRLDVDSVRKKAFEQKAIREEKVEKEEPKEPKREIRKPEKVKEVKDEEIKKSVDELLADSVEEATIVDEDLNVENNIKEIEDELDRIDDELILDDKPKEKDEDDTLEQDLFELIDSMYEDKKEDEE